MIAVGGDGGAVVVEAGRVRKPSGLRRAVAVDERLALEPGELLGEVAR